MIVATLYGYTFITLCIYILHSLTSSNWLVTLTIDKAQIFMQQLRVCYCMSVDYILIITPLFTAVSWAVARKVRALSACCVPVRVSCSSARVVFHDNFVIQIW